MYLDIMASFMFYSLFNVMIVILDTNNLKWHQTVNEMCAIDTIANLPDNWLVSCRFFSIDNLVF